MLGWVGLGESVLVFLCILFSLVIVRNVKQASNISDVQV